MSETKDKYKDLILAAVSSQIPASVSSAEIVINPDSIKGLRASSVIKVDRIFTLKSEKVIAHIGRISVKHIAEFSSIFKSLID